MTDRAFAENHLTGGRVALGESRSSEGERARRENKA
jgi:hypothetical protein